MKITLKQLFDADQALQHLGEAKPTSAKLAYRISRIVTSAKGEQELLNKSQLDLLQKYGTCTDVALGKWAVDWDKRVEFEEQWQALLETEVEVWGDPIKVDDLDGQLNLSIDDYARLHWLFNGD